MAYPKYYLVTMDPNIAHVNLRNFFRSWDFIHKTSSLVFPHGVTGLWRELYSQIRKPYENEEKRIVTHT